MGSSFSSCDTGKLRNDTHQLFSSGLTQRGPERRDVRLVMHLYYSQHAITAPRMGMSNGFLRAFCMSLKMKWAVLMPSDV